MRQLGLTGSIAMGKSYITKILKQANFKQYHIAFFDADYEVKNIIKQEAAKIAAIFPESLLKDTGMINHNILANIIFNDQQKRKKLEAIIHPLVVKKLQEFLKKARYKRVKLVICEIVLLFEKNYQKLFDQVIVASSAKLWQRTRALNRNNMNEEKLKAVLNTQISDCKKRHKANLIIHTGANKANITRQIKALLFDNA